MLPLNPKDYETSGIPPVAPYKRLPTIPNPPPISSTEMTKSGAKLFFPPHPTTEITAHTPVPPPAISLSLIEPNPGNFITPSDFTQPVLQDNFKRPMRRLIHKKKNTVQVLSYID